MKPSYKHQKSYKNIKVSLKNCIKIVFFNQRYDQTSSIHRTDNQSLKYYSDDSQYPYNAYSSQELFYKFFIYSCPVFRNINHQKSLLYFMKMKCLFKFFEKGTFYGEGTYHFLRLGCYWWMAFIVLLVHVGIEPGIFVPDIQYMVDLSQHIAYI